MFTACVWSFGENCQYPCGGYCIDQKCDRFNGTCLYGNCTLGNAFNVNPLIKFVREKKCLKIVHLLKYFLL